MGASEEGLATRDRIARAAWDLVSTEGASAMTIRAVAKRAGVSASVVYHYFDAKQELMDACVEIMFREVRMLEAALARAIDERDDVSATVMRAARVGFRFAREHRAVVRAVAARIAETGDLPAGGSADDRRRMQALFLDGMVRCLPHLADLEETEIRLRVQSLVLLVVRYAQSSDQELFRFTNTNELAAAETAVEDHLAQLASTLLGRA